MKSQHRRPRALSISAGGLSLNADLSLVPSATGIVLFAHGSGSSRLSPRNQFVASVLNEAGLSTLLLDLLTVEEEFLEEQGASRRFDIALLANRLVLATNWTTNYADTRALQIGYFGASTGAAAALLAAARIPSVIRAVVSRGGRPDLAGAALPNVQSPTLLIVGGSDTQVLELNRQAKTQLRCEAKLVVVPGATHLFEEPGTLEKVADLACGWFERFLVDKNRQRAASR